MKLVVLAVVVVVLCVLGAWVLRRRGGDEMHSVDGYRQALETLQEVRTRSLTVTVQAPDQGDPTGEAAGPADHPTVGGEDTHERMVIGGLARPAAADPGRTGPAHARPSAESPRQSRRAMAAMNHGPRRLGGPLLTAAAVIVLVVVLVVAVGARHRPPVSHHGSGHADTSTTPTTSAHQHAAPPPRGTSTTTTVHPTSTTTTTTSPRGHTVYTAEPTSVTASSATYVPPVHVYSFSVTAGTQACWTQITEATSNTVAYAQDLAAGQTEALTITGPATVVLGAPDGVTMKLENEPLLLPIGFGSPFTVALQPPPVGG